MGRQGRRVCPAITKNNESEKATVNHLQRVYRSILRNSLGVVAALIFAIGFDRPNVASAAVENEKPTVDYNALAAGGWQSLPWCSYRFVFQPYGDNWGPGTPNRRVAREAEVQKLLTPVWNDPDYKNMHQVPALHEWAWSGLKERWGGTTKRQCYEMCKAWYLGEREKLLAQPRWKQQYPKDKTIPFASMTGHGWVVHGAAEWGVDWLGIEIGENIDATQLHIAFLRGAARMYQKPTFAGVSQWHGGTVPDFIAGVNEFTQVPFDREAIMAKIYAGGTGLHNGGHSSSIMARMWYVCWLSGIGVVGPEACQGTFFAHGAEHRKKYPGIWDGYDRNTRVELSSYGCAAQRFHAVAQKHPEIGIPYTPMAALLDKYSGFFGFHNFTGMPWGVLPIGPGDRQAFDFLNTFFPNTMRAGGTPEHERLVAAPWGDSLDVLVTGVRDDLLRMYPVVIVLGEHEFLPETTSALQSYVKHGGELFLTQTQADQIGAAMAEGKAAGRVHVYDSDTRESREALLRRLQEKYVPVAVGGKIEYLVNRTPTGWVVGLVNNEGVTKDNLTATKVDRSKDQTVAVRLKAGTAKAAKEWCNDQILDMRNNTVSVGVPAGEVRIVEFIER